MKNRCTYIVFFGCLMLQMYLYGMRKQEVLSRDTLSYRGRLEEKDQYLEPLKMEMATEQGFIVTLYHPRAYKIQEYENKINIKHQFLEEHKKQVSEQVMKTIEKTVESKYKPVSIFTTGQSVQEIETQLEYKYPTKYSKDLEKVVLLNIFKNLKRKKMFILKHERKKPAGALCMKREINMIKQGELKNCAQWYEDNYSQKQAYELVRSIDAEIRQEFKDLRKKEEVYNAYGKLCATVIILFKHIAKCKSKESKRKTLGLNEKEAFHGFVCESSLDCDDDSVSDNESVGDNESEGEEASKVV